MPTTFRPYHPKQNLLMPPDLREWLREDHLAYHVSDLVENLDLAAFYAPYAGDGRRNAPYEPLMMLKVLIYAYASGVFFSRAIAKRLHEDVAFRVLAAGNFPSHRTLCEFHHRHLEDFSRLLVEVVRLGHRAGLVSFADLSLDSTKVQANASKRKAMSYGRMKQEEQRLQGEIEALLKQAEAVDSEEDERLGEEVRGDEVAPGLRGHKQRLEGIRKAKASREAEQHEADEASGRQPGQKQPSRGGSASLSRWRK